MKDDLISRQAAIEIVERYDKSHMALKQRPMLGAAPIVMELEDLPSAQPQPCQNHTQKAPESDTFGVKTGETCSDTISRKAAIDALEIEKTYSAVYKYGYTQTDYFKQYNTGLTDGIKALNKLPSAQPEIIRCKDCKYWMRAYLSISGKHGCNVMRDYTAPDDYCFKAERKA